MSFNEKWNNSREPLLVYHHQSTQWIIPINIAVQKYSFTFFICAQPCLCLAVFNNNFFFNSKLKHFYAILKHLIWFMNLFDWKIFDLSANVVRVRFEDIWFSLESATKKTSNIGPLHVNCLFFLIVYIALTSKSNNTVLARTQYLKQWFVMKFHVGTVSLR